ncbi:MAG: HAD-IC family P-type ATPase [Acetobacteraceae bacterium]
MSTPLAETTAGHPAIPAGLSSAEAARRQTEFGPNAVAEEQIHPLKRVLLHFWSPVPWMLEATIVLQIVIGERIEALLVAALLILNVALGVFQEGRANAALALLKQRLALRVRVRRDGAWADALAAVLVPGDIVQVSLGSVVPADLRMIDGSLLLDQSMLTGESVPAETEPGKTVYAGALVRRGEAIAEVVATGTRTYFGRAAELVRIAHVESAEQKTVLGIVRNLTVVNFTIVVGMVIYAHGIGMSVPEIIPLVLTALLSAVPVALPATFTLAAALGAKALALKGVLLTRLSALHEAAMIDVLCADKTGTLTANTLTVSGGSLRRSGLWRRGCPGACRTRQLGGRAGPDRFRHPVGRGPAQRRQRPAGRPRAVHAVRPGGEAGGGDHHRPRPRDPRAQGRSGRHRRHCTDDARSGGGAGRIHACRIPDPGRGRRAGGQAGADRADRIQRSAASRLGGPARRVAVDGRAHRHGHRRRRRDSRHRRPCDRAGGRGLPAGQHPRRRRPR